MRNQKPKYKEFLETGAAICAAHGIHTEWVCYDSGKSIQCRKCIRTRANEWNKTNKAKHLTIKRKSNRKTRKDYPIKFTLFDAKYRAKRRGLEFSITEKSVMELLSIQNNSCALTGTIFKSLHDISVDRIDSSKGYSIDNIQLVLIDLNYMKSNIPQDQFIEYCKKVVEWNKKI